VAIIRSSEESAMASAANVHNHAGIWIGTVDAGHDVHDHAGVRIGTTDARGDVLDHAHVRIGHVMLP
jgi:hypothetical protein